MKDIVSSIITTSDCVTCATCCKFKKDELYFAPVLTKTELAKILKGTKIPFEYKKHKDSKNVFQIKMIKSKREKDVYVCPFYNEKTTFCQVYKNRPLDCKLYPFIVTKSKKGFSLNIVEVKECLGLTRAGSKKVKNFALNSLKKYQNLNLAKYFTKYPNLAWKKEEWMKKVGEL